MFTPPMDGVYLLTVFVLATDNENGNIYIKNNENVLCQAWVSQGSGKPYSKHLILLLNLTFT